MSPDPDDLQLLRDCLEGKPGPWEALWARHAPAMRRAAAARLGNHADVEEVCQKVLTKLAVESARLLGDFRGDCALQTWLVLLTLGEAVDHQRAERRWHRRILHRAAAPDAVPTPLQTLCVAEDALRLQEALEALPPRDQLLFTLHYWDGLTHAETARILGVSTKSVTSLLQQALGRLRQSLAAGGRKAP